MAVNRISDERRAWLDHLAAQGFPLTEYHSRDTKPERKRELEVWHARLEAGWDPKLARVRK